jgi:DNA polymerase-1
LDKLLAVDMLSIMYRWHHRLAKEPLMFEGVNTSAIHGFFFTVLTLALQYRPTHLVVGAESVGPTFRHRQFADYKSQRPPKPEEMRVAEAAVETLCGQLGIPLLRIEGVEADDVLGTAAVAAAKAGMRVYLLSSDKDFGQLVTENITQVQPQFGGGYKELGPAEIRTKWGVDPEQVVEVLALEGDAVDNVPGVRGIGEKTARALVHEYGTAFAAYARRDEMRASLEAKLDSGRDALVLSRWLVEIRTDLATYLPPFAQLVWAPPTVNSAAPHLRRYGLNKVLNLVAQFAEPWVKKSV